MTGSTQRKKVNLNDETNEQLSKRLADALELFVPVEKCTDEIEKQVMGMYGVQINQIKSILNTRSSEKKNVLAVAPPERNKTQEHTNILQENTQAIGHIPARNSDSITNVDISNVLGNISRAELESQFETAFKMQGSSFFKEGLYFATFQDMNRSLNSVLRNWLNRSKRTKTQLSEIEVNKNTNNVIRRCEKIISHCEYHCNNKEQANFILRRKYSAKSDDKKDSKGQTLFYQIGCPLDILNDFGYNKLTEPITI